MSEDRFDSLTTVGLWSSIMVVKLLRSNTPINPIGIISFGTYLTMAIGVATILEQSTAKLKTL